MAVSVRCPNCAASLVFDADSQRMVCSFCGTEIRPQDLNFDTGSAETAPAEGRSVADAADEAPADTSSAEVSSSPEMWSSDAVSYLCGNCGAAVVSDQNTVATFCAFCGSPTIIQERLVNALRPSELIPFKFGRDEAKQAFFTWCKKGLLTPGDFVSDQNIEKLTGIYVPFFLYDVEVDMKMSCVGITKTSVRSSSSTRITTRYYNVNREMALAWDRIPLDGASHVDDKLMEIIEPFDYKDILPFNMKYLSGFYAEKYDIGAESLEENLRKRAENFTKETFRESCKKYDSIEDTADASMYHKPRYAYSMLPVWMLNYTYRGKKYTFAMNGQTGKIAGEPPISPIKITLIGIATFLAAAGLLYLLGGIL